MTSGSSSVHNSRSYSQSSQNSSIQGGYISSDNEVKNPEEDKFEEDKIENTKTLNIDQLMKKYNLRNNIETQKKFLELKQERRDLRVKLDKFQKEFEQNHKRKIRYTKDIAPVQQDFKRYKDLKGELSKFEQSINADKKAVNTG